MKTRSEQLILTALASASAALIVMNAPLIVPCVLIALGLGIISREKLSVKSLNDRIAFICSKKRDSSIIIGEKSIAIRDKGRVRGLALLKVIDVDSSLYDASDEMIALKAKAFTKMLSVDADVVVMYAKRRRRRDDIIRELRRRANLASVNSMVDPSNVAAKMELCRIENLLKRIELEGEEVYETSIYIMVSCEANSVDEALLRAEGVAEALSKSLHGIGVHTQVVPGKLFEKCINDMLMFKFNGLTLPSKPLCIVSPFILAKKPRKDLYREGVPLGYSIRSNEIVYWNPEVLPNPHVLVLGPTGSGKTETLLSIALSMWRNKKVPPLFVDVKGDITRRMQSLRGEVRIIDAMYAFPHALKIRSYDKSPQARIERTVCALAAAMELDALESYILVSLLKELMPEEKRLTWHEVHETLLSRIEHGADKKIESAYFSLARALAKVSLLDSALDVDVQRVLDRPTIINVSRIPIEDVRVFAEYSLLYEIVAYMESLNPTAKEVRLIIVLDEAWTLASKKPPFETYPLPLKIVKAGRSYGVSLLMATQNPQDLEPYADLYLQNVGTLIAMNAGDKQYWAQLSRYADISIREVDELVFLKRGEGLVRFLGDPRPLVVRIFKADASEEEEQACGRVYSS